MSGDPERDDALGERDQKLLDGLAAAGFSAYGGTAADPEDSGTGTNDQGHVETFLERYWEDQDGQGVRPLEEYLAMFPGHARAIAREYLALEEEARETPSAPTAFLDAGDRLGPYEVVRELGRGGQGVVYLAEDTRLHRKVALKLLTNIGPGSETMLKRFQREAEVASKLEHPGICGVHDAGVERGAPYIAMRYIDGETLAERIVATRSLAERPVRTAADGNSGESTRPESPCPASTSTSVDRKQVLRLVELFERVARALHAAHEAGIIHRDIKPSNIIIGSDDQPVILDFGLAQDTDSLATLTLSREFFGTLAYMSPEQLMPQASRPDRRTDVWSLGVSLFECLALRRPFQAPTWDALQKTILTEDPPNPRNLNHAIPTDLQVVLETALKKRLSHRYQTALELAEELRRVREHEPILAKPVGPWGRLVRWAQRHPGVAASLSLAFLILVAGSVVSTIFGVKAASAQREAETKSANVFRLRAFQTLADLQERADEDLWPLIPERPCDLPGRIEAHQAWLDDARRLVAGLQEADPETGARGHRAQLEELRRRALPQTEEEKEADRRSHPRWEQLRSLKTRLTTWRRAQAVRAGREKATPFALDETSLLGDAEDLNELAWPLVDPDRKTFGKEAEGLALARRAAELSERKDTSEILHTLAWALFANGLDEESKGAMDRAVQAAPNAWKREALVESQIRLGELTQAWSPDRGARLLGKLEADISALGDEVSQRWTFAFTSENDRWWHAQVEKLVKELGAFCNPETGLIAGVSPESGWGVQRRLDYVRTLEQRKLLDQTTAWKKARARVASNPKYSDDPDLLPQLGLVPLGPDPVSTLEEFAETATGVPPKRDLRTDELMLTEEMGLVFVLVPGGTFMMGAQASDPAGSNHDPEAKPMEGPVHKVTVPTFFLSKYETTQGQWQRFTGANPSSHKPGSRFGGRVTTLLHPVEQLSWRDCDRMLGRLGLLLPTEDQWEYACRAGTTTPWWCGKDGLVKAANLADSSFHRNGALPDWPYESWDDGHTVHAPVGTFAANGFGLHDVHGNVFEWCREEYGGYRSEHPRAEDSVREVSGIRGGGWNYAATYARSSARQKGPTGARDYDLGFRPARSLTR